MVPGAGLEPARCCHRGILSLLIVYQFRHPGSSSGLFVSSVLNDYRPLKGSGSIHDEFIKWEYLQALKVG